VSRAPTGHEHRAERLSDLGDGALIKRLWPYMAPHRRLFITALLLYIPITAAIIAEPYIIGEAIDRFMQGNGNTPERLAGLTHLALLGLGVVVLAGALLMAQQLCMQRLGLLTLRDLRSKAFNKALRLDIGTFDHEPVGRIMARLTNDIDSLAEVFALGAVGMVADLILLLAISFWLFWLHPGLALRTLLVVPPLLLVMSVFQRFAHNTYGALRRRSSALNAYLQEALNGLTTVQLFNAGDYLSKRYDEQAVGYREAAFKTIRYDVSLFAVIECIGTISTAVILWYGAGAIEHGTVTLGLLIAFSEYMRRFFAPLRDLGSKYALLQGGFASADRIFGLMDTPVTTGDREGATALANPIEELRLNTLDFSYIEDEPVLRNIDLTVRRGERVALVGRTGSGKTTILSLICRFRQPTAGSVTINGLALDDLAIDSLRQRIGVVQQDSYLFAGSLEANITMRTAPSEDPADAERLQQVTRGAHLDVISERLAKRSKTQRAAGAVEILEGGSNLSAGERQLVAMARALYREPELLLLDEATANIDQHTERLLQDTTATLLAGRTALIIAHRLSTIETADRIVVLDEGKIAEQGTHKELLAAGGMYAEMVERHEALQSL
jgi:ATP-binding cassette, subfamily B, multidrug efflux pump